MHALENIHSLHSVIKSVTFFNCNGKLTQLDNIIEHQTNAFGRKETFLNKLLTFLSTMQQMTLRLDHFEQNMSGEKIEVGYK